MLRVERRPVSPLLFTVDGRSFPSDPKKKSSSPPQRSSPQPNAVEDDTLPLPYIDEKGCYVPSHSASVRYENKVIPARVQFTGRRVRSPERIGIKQYFKETIAIHPGSILEFDRPLSRTFPREVF